MGYDDARFIGRNSQDISVAAQTSTFTASDHVLTVSNAQRVPLARACKLLGGAVVVTTAGTSKVPKFHVLQSTLTGIALAPSHTLGASAAATITATRSYTAGEVAGVEVVHTGTASAAQASPAAEISLDFQDQFV